MTPRSGSENWAEEQWSKLPLNLFSHPEEPLKTASRRARENAQRLSSSFDKLRMRGKRGDRIMLKVTKFQLKGRAECLRRGFFIKQAND
jgi:hypothetical protein